jgi:transcriptional regulator with XRE-family HTH domain
MDNNKEQIDIGARIKAFRNQLGLSQVEFAGAVDMYQAQVSRVEVGLSELRVSDLLSISAVFGVSMDAIIGNSPDAGLSAELTRLRWAVSAIRDALNTL